MKSAVFDGVTEVLGPVVASRGQSSSTRASLIDIVADLLLRLGPMPLWPLRAPPDEAHGAKVRAASPMRRMARRKLWYP